MVLGGGGAKGAAHLGMLQSILEAGIPIDKIGGTSIGAFAGALWAIHRDMDVVAHYTNEMFEKLSSVQRVFMDLTCPITSDTSGTAFDNGMKDVFGEDIEIEDLWIPYYCISTNVTLSRERFSVFHCGVSSVPIAISSIQIVGFSVFQLPFLPFFQFHLFHCSNFPVSIFPVLMCFQCYNCLIFQYSNCCVPRVPMFQLLYFPVSQWSYFPVVNYDVFQLLYFPGCTPAASCGPTCAPP